MSECGEPDIERFLASHGPFEKAPLARSGEAVGDWRVTAFLGRGATSEVYRAENAVTRQVGAVKLFTRGDDRALARFRREVSLLAEADSAALPRFYGAGEHAGRAFLAMELLEPAELPSADSAVARFILGVCAGVEALHARGYVHRDIKPHNVMCRPSTGELFWSTWDLRRSRGNRRMPSQTRFPSWTDMLSESEPSAIPLRNSSLAARSVRRRTSMRSACWQTRASRGGRQRPGPR